MALRSILVVVVLVTTSILNISSFIIHVKKPSTATTAFRRLPELRPPFTRNASPLQAVEISRSRNEAATEKKNVPAKALSISALALFSLVFQNSGLTIFMKMSKQAAKVKAPGHVYISSTAVVASEFLKLLCSLYCFNKFDNGGKLSKTTDALKHELRHNWRDGLLIAIPAALYVLQNNLQYVAVSNVAAGVYQTLIQTKIITTALFTSILLKRHHTLAQWASILTLAIGVAVVQLSFGITGGARTTAIGLTAIAVSAITSGFAGVYTEKVIKQTPTSLWVRNIQMTLISLFLALGASIGKDFGAISKYGFFSGYDPLVMTTIFLQALGGILISLVVKHASSVTKAFATSISIIVSCLVSSLYLKDCTLTPKFFIGVFMVCAASVSYSLCGKKRPDQSAGIEASVNVATMNPSTEEGLTRSSDISSSTSTSVETGTAIPISDIRELPSSREIDVADEMEFLDLNDDSWVMNASSETDTHSKTQRKADSSVYLFSKDISFASEESRVKAEKNKINRFSVGSVYEFSDDLNQSLGNSTKNFPAK